MVVNNWIAANLIWITLVIAIIVLIYFVFTIIQTTRKKRRFVSQLNIILLILGLMFLIFLTYRASEIEGADWGQIILMIGLVAITAAYASSAEKQADASIKMAEATRAQLLVMNKPNVILELIKVTPEKHLIGRIVNDSGRGPAINTEIYIDHPLFKFNKVRYTWSISVGDEKGFDFHMEEPSTEIDPKIAISSIGVIVANYEDVSGNQWHSTLELQWDEGFKPRDMKIGISGHYRGNTND